MWHNIVLRKHNTVILVIHCDVIHHNYITTTQQAMWNTYIMLITSDGHLNRVPWPNHWYLLSFITDHTKVVPTILYGKAFDKSTSEFVDIIHMHALREMHKHITHTHTHYTPTNTHVHTHILSHKLTHTSTHMQLSVCTRIHAHTCTRMHAHTHTTCTQHTCVHAHCPCPHMHKYIFKRLLVRSSFHWSLVVAQYSWVGCSYH